MGGSKVTVIFSGEYKLHKREYKVHKRVYKSPSVGNGSVDPSVTRFYNEPIMSKIWTV